MTRRLRSSLVPCGLSLVALCLLGSAGLRLLPYLDGSALAARANTEASPPGPPTAAAEDTADAFLQELQRRAAALDAREAAVAGREGAVAEAEAALAEGLATLAAAETRLGELLTFAETAAEQDVTRLTTIYEAMKPAQAAELFARMRPDFAAGFLARMQAEAAGAILAGLEPDAAYAVSVALAGRNAIPPQ